MALDARTRSSLYGKFAESSALYASRWWGGSTPDGVARRTVVAAAGAIIAAVPIVS